MSQRRPEPRTRNADGELIALLGGQVVGTVRQSQTTGRFTFIYDAVWRDTEGAFPLSCSMPLTEGVHDDPVVRAYLWGLLPDNDRILAAWGRQFSVSANNPFALLAQVGEDCAGAVQFVTPERLDSLLNSESDEVTWLSETDIAERLRLLRQSGGTVARMASDTGQFSLPGAQPKTALLKDPATGRWGVPSGRIPTTHILKPPMHDYDGFVENEHFCLELARTLGLPAAESVVLRAEDELAICVTRFDRVWFGETLVRLHQEDFCQALGVMPQVKYESQGGPGIPDIVRLLREQSSEAAVDEHTFLDAVALTWIIANTDAHAKNYALLMGYGGHVRLAPLYDLGSALPYHATLNPYKIKLAMRIGKEYRIRHLSARSWDALAENLRIDPPALRDRLRHMIARVPDAVADVRRKAIADGLTHFIIAELEQTVITHATQCARRLNTVTQASM